MALWCGDLGAAERYLGLLLDHSSAHALGLWRAWGECFKGVALIKRGDAAAGLHALRSVLAETSQIRSLPRYLGLLGELAAAMGQAGETAQALETIDAAIERSERRHEQWCLAELLRIKGELVLQERAPHAIASATSCFRRALDLARRQSVLSFELRTAISLARLQRDQGDVPGARKVLGAVYRRFTEGLATPDLRSM